jgi:hypothetical protein
MNTYVGRRRLSVLKIISCVMVMFTKHTDLLENLDSQFFPTTSGQEPLWGQHIQTTLVEC